MAWTAPTTRATGDLITASIWNTDLVDNLSALRTAFTGEWAGTGNADGGSVAVADVARFMPVVVRGTMVVVSFQFRAVGGALGNSDVGIYSQDLATRHWSWGSFAAPAAGQITKLISGGTPTSLTLNPGVYYLAMVNSSTTNMYATAADGLSYQTKTRAASLPLPADASSAAAADVLPWCCAIVS